MDHQCGKINGLSIDKDIAYGAKKNGIIGLSSLNIPKYAQFHVNDVPEVKVGDWADHLRGATKMLSEKYPLQIGLCGVIEGSLPIGGLSSSASVIIAFLSALCKVNDIHLTPMELILTAKATGNEYVGVLRSKLNQSCEVLANKDHLLYLDTMDDTYELIQTNPNMKPYQVAIFSSGIERSLATFKYNMRMDGCKSAAYALKSYRWSMGSIRRRASEMYLELYLNNTRTACRKHGVRRAEHYYGVVARAEAGTEAWRNGDPYVKLIFESRYSSIYSYENGTD